MSKIFTGIFFPIIWTVKLLVWSTSGEILIGLQKSLPVFRITLHYLVICKMYQVMIVKCILFRVYCQIYHHICIFSFTKQYLVWAWFNKCVLGSVSCSGRCHRGIDWHHWYNSGGEVLLIWIKRYYLLISVDIELFSLIAQTVYKHQTAWVHDS